MTPEEIEQGNKLIAEFMGWTKGIGCWHHHDDGGYRESLIEYHNDWNELMPVVEKIRSLGGRFIIGDSSRVTVYNKDYDWRNGLTEDSLLECAWHGVTQFITWYNKQS